MGYNVAVLDVFFGDTGKGRVATIFGSNADWIIKFNGSLNAGHTIYRDGKKYVHNLLPSVDWRVSRTKAFIGSGTVVDLEHLLKEVANAEQDFPGAAKRIYVDPDAFLVLPEHREEDKLKNGHIGTTNKGVGPAYAAKIERRGFRVKDVILGKETSQKSFYDQLVAIGVQFKHVLELEDNFKKSDLVFEASQGVMIDINHGTYPFVSTSDCCISGIYANGFSFVKFDKVYGILKAYSTRVGSGPMPTEYFGEEAEALRQKGGEFGATTGRPRRVGAVDLPAVKYSAKKAGVTDLIVTKFDILNGDEKVKICSKYEKEPICPADFFDCKPIIEEIDGWKDASDLDQIKPFIYKIQKATGFSVEYVSYGVEDKDFLKVK